MTNQNHISQITTADGTSTLYDSKLDVTYRSKFGAHKESQYVFLEGTGILDIPDVWKVGELGFGAGLNFSNTAREARNRNILLEYHTVERAPVKPEFLPDYGWPTRIAKQALSLCAESETSPVVVEDNNIKLVLYVSEWQSASLPRNLDAFYHDPFGPRTDVESWSDEVFRWSFEALKPGHKLSTYSAASRVKKAMKTAGYQILVRPGLPPKREVVSGLKT